MESPLPVCLALGVIAVVLGAIVLIAVAFAWRREGKRGRPTEELYTEFLVLGFLKPFGRDLVFPFHGDNSDLDVTSRASNNLLVKTTPVGKCPTSLGDRPQYSLIEENGIYYKVQRACVSLRHDGVRHLSDGSLIIAAKTDTRVDAYNLMTFLLLTPLVVYFCRGDGCSNPYVLDARDVRATTTDTDEEGRKTLKFFPVLNHRRNCDRSLSAKQDNLATRYVRPEDEVVQAQVYHLSDADSDLQETGRSHPCNQTPTNRNRIVLYTPHYLGLAKTPHRVAEYNFMKKIDNCYANRITPVVTVQISFQCSPDMLQRSHGPVRILHARGVAGGVSTACSGVLFYVSVAAVKGDASSFRVSVHAPDGRDCGGESRAVHVSSRFGYANELYHLTLVKGNTEMFVVLRRSASDVTYHRRAPILGPMPPFDTCAPPPRKENHDDMSRLFSKRFAHGREPPLDGLVMEWNGDYTKKVHAVDLGYPPATSLLLLGR
jgi:hypothetical protein